MYTIFVNDDMTNYSLVSKNSNNYFDYLSSRIEIMSGTKKECLDYLQELEEKDLLVETFV